MNSKRRCSRLHECNVPVFIHISMKCFIPLFVCIVFISSSSVARHVPSRFRIIVVGFQRARLFSRRRRRGRRRTTTAGGAAVFAQRARKIHRRRKKRENDRFPVDRARWFPRAHRVSSFLKQRHFGFAFERHKCDASGTKRCPPPVSPPLVASPFPL